MGLAVLQSASAADLPLKAPSLIAASPIRSWTGFYAGVHVGAGWGTSESSADIGALVAGLGIPGLGFRLPLASHNINGFVAGGQVGYNWQSGNLVYGVEGSASWSGLDGAAPCLFILSCKTEVNWTGDISARLGFLASDRLMVFVKGGLAFADFDYSAGNVITLGGGGVSLTTSLSDTRVGGLLGMGAEYAFLPNWTAKIEYNYMDFGKENYSFPVTAAATGIGAVTINTPIEIKNQIHLMKFGTNYRF